MMGATDGQDSSPPPDARPGQRPGPDAGTGSTRESDTDTGADTGSSSIPDCTDGAGGVDCAQVFARLDLILDRELPASELLEMEGHLTACLHCADRAEFEQKLRALIRERCVDTAPATLVADIRAALRLPAG